MRWREAGGDYLGTSHRQASVRFMVGALRNGLSELLNLPDGYEVVLGNGGTTAFWDAATFGLIERRSQHLASASSRRSSRPGSRGRPVPRPRPSVIESDPGTASARRGRRRRRRLLPHPQRDVDRGGDAGRPARRRHGGQLVLVDATSAAGGLPFDAGRDRRLLLRAAEGAGRRRRAVVGRHVARRRRAHRAAGGVRPLDPGVPRPGHRPREQPQGPDVQHAGAGHDLPRRPASGVDQRQRRAGLVRRPRAPFGRRPLRLGRRRRRTPPRSSADPAMRSPVVGHHRPRQASTRPPCRPCSGRTASSTPNRTASWAATSSASPCSPPSTPTTSRR